MKSKVYFGIFMITILSFLFLLLLLWSSSFPIQSQECQNKVGIRFSNHTDDLLYRIDNTCFGWSNGLGKSRFFVEKLTKSFEVKE